MTQAPRALRFVLVLATIGGLAACGTGPGTGPGPGPVPESSSSNYYLDRFVPRP